MSFKILAIGDIHGREVLSRIRHADFDKIVFIGDYVDTHYEADFTDAMFISNLQKIIRFKQDHLVKVILLLGNHDIHYMYHEEVGSFTGFRPGMLHELKALYLENSDLFRVAWEYKNTLFTHAGISNNWYQAYNGAIHEELRKIKKQTGMERPLTISDKLNCLRSTAAGRQILFSVSGLRMYPPDPGRLGGPIWADKQETQGDYLKNYHQVVGHTMVESIETKKSFYDESSSITYIDTENREFLEMEV